MDGRMDGQMFELIVEYVDLTELYNFSSSVYLNVFIPCWVFLNTPTLLLHVLVTACSSSFFFFMRILKPFISFTF